MENDLARFLGKFTQQLQEKGSRMAMLAGGIAIVVLLFWVLRSTRASAVRDDWTQFQETNDAMMAATMTLGSDVFSILEQYESVASTASEPILAIRAYASWGQSALVFLLTAENDEDRRSLNREAERAFSAMQRAYGSNPMARAVALCGLATVEENEFVFDGNVETHKENARLLLEQVRDDEALAGNPIQREALRRLNTLDRVFVSVTFPEKAPEPLTQTPSSAAAEEPATPVSAEKGTDEEKSGGVVEEEVKEGASSEPAASSDASSKSNEPSGGSRR